MNMRKNTKIIVAIVLMVIALILMFMAFMHKEELPIIEHKHLPEAEKDITELSEEELLKMPIEVVLLKIEEKKKQHSVLLGQIDLLNRLIEKSNVPTIPIIVETITENTENKPTQENSNTGILGGQVVDQVNQDIAKTEIENSNEPKTDLPDQATATKTEPVKKERKCKLCDETISPDLPVARVLGDKCYKEWNDSGMTQKTFIKKKFAENFEKTTVKEEIKIETV